MLLLELISQTDTSTLGRMRYNVEDQAEVGPYGLFLVDMGESGLRSYGVRYQLGLNKKETSFTDMFSQDDKYIEKGEKVQISFLPEFDRVIKGWIAEKGVLSVGSANPKKTEFYKKLLSRRGFNVEDKGMFFTIT